MKNISAKIPEALIEGIDELVKIGMYQSRSAIRDLLKKELWKK